LRALGMWAWWNGIARGVLPGARGRM